MWIEQNILNSWRRLYPSSIASLFKHLFTILIAFYRAHLSGWLGGNCRFYPSCSEYAAEAFKIHTPGTAAALTCCRLLKCHPLSTSSQTFDPVPLKISLKENRL